MSKESVEEEDRTSLVHACILYSVVHSPSLFPLSLSIPSHRKYIVRPIVTHLFTNRHYITHSYKYILIFRFQQITIKQLDIGK